MKANKKPCFNESEFLKLAGSYLACRWKVMGHFIDGDPHHGDIGWDLLGMIDHQLEMELIVKECLCSHER